ncbi:MAG: hypothetical protein ABR591_11510 [Candidatus Velthaea sp.]
MAANQIPDLLKLQLWHRGDPPSWVIDKLSQVQQVEIAKAEAQLQKALLTAHMAHVDAISKVLEKL